MTDPKADTETANGPGVIGLHARLDATRPIGRLLLTPAQRVDRDGSLPGADGAIPAEPMLLTQAAFGVESQDAPAGSVGTQTDAPPRDASPGDMALERKVAALKDLIARNTRPDTRNPDTGGGAEPDPGDTEAGADISGTANPVTGEHATAGSDAAMPDSSTDPRPTPAAVSDVLTDAMLADSKTDAPGNVFSDLIGGIDEMMLRDLVADVVRQELQGVLGDRITRNVRTLVRREIQHALVSPPGE